MAALWDSLRFVAGRECPWSGTCGHCSVPSILLGALVVASGTSCTAARAGASELPRHLTEAISSPVDTAITPGLYNGPPPPAGDYELITDTAALLAFLATDSTATQLRLVDGFRVTPCTALMVAPNSNITLDCQGSTIDLRCPTSGLQVAWDSSLNLYGCHVLWPPGAGGFLNAIVDNAQVRLEDGATLRITGGSSVQWCQALPEAHSVPEIRADAGALVPEWHVAMATSSGVVRFRDSQLICTDAGGGVDTSEADFGMALVNLAELSAANQTVAVSGLLTLRSASWHHRAAPVDGPAALEGDGPRATIDFQRAADVLSLRPAAPAALPADPATPGARGLALRNLTLVNLPRRPASRDGDDADGRAALTSLLWFAPPGPGAALREAAPPLLTLTSVVAVVECDEVAFVAAYSARLRTVAPREAQKVFDFEVQDGGRAVFFRRLQGFGLSARGYRVTCRSVPRVVWAPLPGPLQLSLEDARAAADAALAADGGGTGGGGGGSSLSPELLWALVALAAVATVCLLAAVVTVVSHRSPCAPLVHHQGKAFSPSSAHKRSPHHGSSTASSYPSPRLAAPPYEVDMSPSGADGAAGVAWAVPPHPQHGVLRRLDEDEVAEQLFALSFADPGSTDSSAEQGGSGEGTREGGLAPAAMSAAAGARGSAASPPAPPPLPLGHGSPPLAGDAGAPGGGHVPGASFVSSLSSIPDYLVPGEELPCRSDMLEGVVLGATSDDDASTPSPRRDERSPGAAGAPSLHALSPISSASSGGGSGAAAAAAPAAASAAERRSSGVGASPSNSGPITFGTGAGRCSERRGAHGIGGAAAAAAPFGVSPTHALEQCRHDVMSEHLEIEGVIGGGGYGAVYRGTWRGLEVAVKTVTFEVPGPYASGMQHRALEEATLAYDLSHANVVRSLSHEIQCISAAPPRGSRAAHSMELTTFKLYMIQEFCAGGSLANFIRHGHLRAEGGGVNIERTLMLLRDVAAGMAYVHANSIAHGDLNPSNILLQVPPSARCDDLQDAAYATKLFDAAAAAALAARALDNEQCSAKVSDFGLSVQLRHGAVHTSGSTCSGAKPGAPFYAAPEVHESGRLLCASDTFSFGVIMWECFMGRPPFVHDPAGCATPAPGFPQLPDVCPFNFAVLALACMAPTPTDRPPFFQVYEVLTSLDVELASGSYVDAAGHTRDVNDLAVATLTPLPAADTPRGYAAVPAELPVLSTGAAPALACGAGGTARGGGAGDGGAGDAGAPGETRSLNALVATMTSSTVRTAARSPGGDNGGAAGVATGGSGSPGPCTRESIGPCSGASSGGGGGAGAPGAAALRSAATVSTGDDGEGAARGDLDAPNPLHSGACSSGRASDGSVSFFMHMDPSPSASRVPGSARRQASAGASSGSSGSPAAWRILAAEGPMDGQGGAGRAHRLRCVRTAAVAQKHPL